MSEPTYRVVDFYQADEVRTPDEISIASTGAAETSANPNVDVLFEATASPSATNNTDADDNIPSSSSGAVGGTNEAWSSLPMNFLRACEKHGININTESSTANSSVPKPIPQPANHPESYYEDDPWIENISPPENNWNNDTNDSVVDIDNYSHSPRRYHDLTLYADDDDEYDSSYVQSGTLQHRSLLIDIENGENPTARSEQEIESVAQSDDSHTENGVQDYFIGSVRYSKGLFDQIVKKIRLDEERTASYPQCRICLDHFVTQKYVRQLFCNHIFHGDCLIEWLKERDTCPNCRANVVDDVILTIIDREARTELNYYFNNRNTPQRRRSAFYICSYQPLSYPEFLCYTGLVFLMIGLIYMCAYLL